MQLLQCTASLPGSSGQCNSCNALLHRLGAVDSATPAMHCLTAWGQWTVQLLQCTASLPWGQWAVQLLQCTASLPGGSGQCNPCIALPHCLGTLGSAKPSMHCLTALGQWGWELLQCTASLPGGSGQCNSCNALPHCPGGSGQCNACNALPHYPGAVGSVLWCSAAVRGCALCCVWGCSVSPGVSCCAFPVLSALCDAVLRCAGALVLCCSCGLRCLWCLVLWCLAVCCAVSCGVLCCVARSGCMRLSSGRVFRCRCPCLQAWTASLWFV